MTYLEGEDSQTGLLILLGPLHTNIYRIRKHLVCKSEEYLDEKLHLSFYLLGSFMHTSAILCTSLLGSKNTLAMHVLGAVPEVLLLQLCKSKGRLQCHQLINSCFQRRINPKSKQSFMLTSCLNRSQKETPISKVNSAT